MNSTTILPWLYAARPKTLIAAIVPVTIGASLAFAHESLLWIPTLVALFCALLIQIGTNFANDYFDFIKGSDREDRIGFERMTSKGLISAQSMKNATIITMALAFLAGMYLVWHGGWIILLIGVLSILFGVAYTGGPFPLGYNGLGDIFVFIFFGFIAVMGTYYVNTFEWGMESFWASLAVGALCVNILVVNNLRDSEADRLSGKKTLGVLFGDNALKFEYLVMIMLAYAIPPHFLVQEGYNAIILLPFLILPLAIKLVITIFRTDEKIKLNRTLEQTAQFMFLFGILFAIGILFGT